MSGSKRYSIDRPDFLHAPRHGSSYVTNAQVHANSVIIATLDIRRFYPSSTSEHVFPYLYHRLGMAADVAGILTKVCTIEGRLPFGSPLSPILCFQVHRHMFASIEQMCRANGLAMTLYVDDIAISGKSVPSQLIYEVKKLIHNVGLQYHKVRRSSRTRKPVITGVQITEQGIAPANKSHLRMKEKLAELNATTVPEARLKIVDSLIGLNQHMLQTYSDTNAAHERLHRQRSWLHNERRRLQRQLVGTRVIGELNISPTEDDELPAPF